MINFKQVRVRQSKNTVYYYWGLKKYVFGSLGSNVRFSPNSYFGHSENIYIEDDVFLARETYMDAVSEIHIGSGTLIGPRCTFIGSTHNYNSDDLQSLPYDNTIWDRKIILEKNVWIGASVMICPGTHIGEGAVIGAGVCVYGEIPPFAVVVSNGYRVVKERNIQKYQELAKKNILYNNKFAGTPFIKRNE